MYSRTGDTMDIFVLPLVNALSTKIPSTIWQLQTTNFLVPVKKNFIGKELVVFKPADVKWLNEYLKSELGCLSFV